MVLFGDMSIILCVGVFFVVCVCVYLFFVLVFFVFLLPINVFLISSTEVMIKPSQWFSDVLILRNPDKFLLIVL